MISRKSRFLVTNDDSDDSNDEIDDILIKENNKSIDESMGVHKGKKKKRSTESKTKEKSVKKGPGRPRKIPKKEPIPRKGIAKTPSDSAHSIEFLYDQPIILKKIIAFFKSLASSQIQIIFRKEDIIFYAPDHYKKSRIRVRIDAHKINHYYCAHEVSIGINGKDIELVLNKVDKEYSGIYLLMTSDNTQKNITIMMENDIQIDEEHLIDLVGDHPHMENEEEFISEDYMINFTLPGRYFKKSINDIKAIACNMSVQQIDKDQPLEFGYVSDNKKIRCRNIIRNTNKVKFESRLKANDTFRIDIKVDHIKPISSAHITDDIMIFVDENKKFMTKALIDNGTVEIKTLTDLIRNE
jgi:hypothetical protein